MRLVSFFFHCHYYINLLASKYLNMRHQVINFSVLIAVWNQAIEVLLNFHIRFVSKKCSHSRIQTVPTFKNMIWRDLCHSTVCMGEKFCIPCSQPKWQPYQFLQPCLDWVWISDFLSWTKIMYIMFIDIKILPQLLFHWCFHSFF